jgi:superfamily II DNA or RNA helicase
MDDRTAPSAPTAFAHDVASIFARPAAPRTTHRAPVAPRAVPRPVDPRLVSLDRTLGRLLGALRPVTLVLPTPSTPTPPPPPRPTPSPASAPAPPSCPPEPAPSLELAPAPAPAPDAFLPPVLHADYDDRGRLVLTPGWLVPSSDSAPARIIRPDRATPESVLEGGFGEDDAGALRLLEAVPEPLRAAFAAPPRVLEGDAIPQALAALRGTPAFHAAPRVAASRVLEEAPRLASIDLGEDARGWLELDASYRSGDRTVTLGEVLAAVGARYLRVGDDFVPAPKGPLVEEARSRLAAARALGSTDATGGAAPGAGSPADAGAVAVPPLALLRALAREPGRLEATALAGASSTARALAALASGAPPVPAPAPLGYTGTLRPHQRSGLDWLWSLREARLGGILADEMGLGKTHMTLALVCAARAAGAAAPSLVVAPTSVLDAWVERCRAFAPGLTPVRYAGPERAEHLSALGAAHLVVTTYGVLVRDADALAALSWEVAALDEAHRVKNPDTEAARAARRLSARVRLAITGTPVENRPGEVKALLDFAVPGYLPPPERFLDLERAVAAGDPEATEHLRRLVHPFKLRRRKRDVLDDLPGKREETRLCNLTDAQASLYREVLAEARAALRSGPSLVPVLAALTRLKRLCDHPSLVLPDGAGRELPSGKLALLEEVLTEAAAAGRKVVVFSQYLEMLDLIEERCAARGIAAQDLRGSTRDRAGAIRRFQEDPSVRVMCVSLLAGGLGIDLTAADVVVHYDRWWNAAREDQATDRVHRIGQTREVDVLRLVTRGTLEERIDAVIARKARLLDDVVEADDPALARSLGREEIAALLEAA